MARDYAKSEGILPLMLAPIRQLGLKVAYGLDGFPSNRIAMIYGTPGGGKSSLFHYLAGEYEKNSDEVILAETEKALDRIYMGSFFELPKQLSKEEATKTALEYFLKETNKLIKEENKAKEAEKFVSPYNTEILEKRQEDIPVLLKELKEGKPGEESVIPRSRRNGIIKTALAEYKLRNVDIFHPRTLEDLEKDLINRMEAKAADPNRKYKRLLIGIDSVGCLLPQEDLDKAVSSDGRSLMTAKYLHTWVPRLLDRVYKTETTLIFIMQQNTTIKMNMFEQKSEIDSVTAKGGSAIKFGATFMIEVEKKKRGKDVHDMEVNAGVIYSPKAKLRAGGKGTLEARFFLKESSEKSLMDFDEPFILGVLEEQMFGIKKKGSKHCIPESLIKNHPLFKDEFETNLKTGEELKLKGSKNDDLDEDEDESEGKEQPNANMGELYLAESAANIVDKKILINSPDFVDVVKEHYEIAEPI